MKVGIVPSSLIKKAGRMDADFYIGTQEEQRVERAKIRIANAKQGLRNARAALAKRNKDRRRLGIKTKVTKP